VKTVLVVDDSESVVSLLQLKLHKKNYAVLIARSYAELQKIFEKNRSLHCAIVDWNLEGVEKGQAVSFLTEQGIPSIVLSGELSLDLQEQIRDKKNVDYVYKGDIFAFDYVVYIIDRLREIDNRKALVVNDSKTQTYVIKTYLEELTFQVFVASSAEEGLALMDTHANIQFVFTDYILPKMNGVQFISKLRKKFSPEELIIIALTGSTSRDLAIHLLKAGANDFISKPFRKEEFNKRIFKEMELLSILEENRRYMAIIDDYVIFSRTDIQGRIKYASTALCRAVGYSKEELLGQTHKIFRHPDTSIDKYNDILASVSKMGSWSGEVRNQKKDGRPFWVNLLITPVFDHNGKLTEYIYLRNDITARKEIETLATLDYLTKLKNRKYFDAKLAALFLKYSQTADRISVIFFDVDFFKKINDTHGHEKGDFVLKSLARLVRKQMNKKMLAARWGGEEFIILDKEPLQFAEKFAEFLRRQIEMIDFGNMGTVTCSFGVTSNRSGDNEVLLLKRADEALYNAKNSGRNQVRTL